MRNMHDSIRLLISDAILKTSYGSSLSQDQIYDQLVDPPQPELGDYAFGCFQLSKLHKKSPAQIATELGASIVPDGKIEKAQAVGPYLNFRVSMQAKGKAVLDKIQNGDFFKTELTKNNPKTTK